MSAVMLEEKPTESEDTPYYFSQGNHNRWNIYLRRSVSEGLHEDVFIGVVFDDYVAGLICAVLNAWRSQEDVSSAELDDMTSGMPRADKRKVKPS